MPTAWADILIGVQDLGLTSLRNYLPGSVSLMDYLAADLEQGPGWRFPSLSFIQSVLHSRVLSLKMLEEIEV